MFDNENDNDLRQDTGYSHQSLNDLERLEDTIARGREKQGEREEKQSKRRYLFAIPLLAVAGILLVLGIVMFSASKKVTVLFVVDGVITERISVNPGETVAKDLAPKVNVAGFDFVGWYANEAATTEWDFGTTIEKDTKIYAGLNPRDIKLTIFLNDGTGKYYEIFTKTRYQVGLLKQNIVEANVPQEVIDRYQIIGFSTLPDATNASYAANSTYTVPPINTTLYAVWAAKNYNIVYQLDGGSMGVGSSMFYKYSASKQTATVNDPIKTGYAFTGWTITPSELTIQNKKLTIPADAIGNITLTASWEIVRYNLTINYDNGSDPTSLQLEYQETYTLTTPTRSGYQFMGWQVTAGATLSDKGVFTMGDADATITAQWAQKPEWQSSSMPEALKLNYQDGDRDDYWYDGPTSFENTLTNMPDVADLSRLKVSRVYSGVRTPVTLSVNTPTADNMIQVTASDNTITFTVATYAHANGESPSLHTGTYEVVYTTAQGVTATFTFTIENSH